MIAILPIFRLTIEGELPDLNTEINSAKRHWAEYRSKKETHTDRVAWLARIQKVPVFDKPVGFIFNWYCKNLRKDPDNIAFGKKYILDGLKVAGRIKNDSLKEVVSFQDYFHLDRLNPRVEVEIREI